MDWAYQQKLQRGVLVVAALVMASCIGLMDVVTGYEINLGLFYLVPIVLATWYGGLLPGMFLSVACVIGMFFVDNFVTRDIPFPSHNPDSVLEHGDSLRLCAAFVARDAVALVGRIRCNRHGCQYCALRSDRQRVGRAANLGAIRMERHPSSATTRAHAGARSNIDALERFLHVEAASGVALIAPAAIALALVLGKPAGILAATWIAVRAGLCRLPQGVTWLGVLLTACLGGIGFTMSIFIATLAFPTPPTLAAAKLGVLLASLSASVLGVVLGRAYLRRLAVGSAQGPDLRAGHPCGDINN